MALIRAGAPPPAYLQTRTPEWVVFTCAGQRFAFSLERVREVLRPRSMTRLPGCGPEVLGLTTLRGRILTVFDLGIVLGGSGAARQPDHRLLLIEHRGRLVAGVVDDVVAVARVRLDPAAESRGGPQDREDRIGTGEWDDGAFVALDADRLLEGLVA